MSKAAGWAAEHVLCCALPAAEGSICWQPLECGVLGCLAYFMHCAGLSMCWTTRGPWAFSRALHLMHWLPCRIASDREAEDVLEHTRGLGLSVADAEHELILAGGDWEEVSGWVGRGLAEWAGSASGRPDGR